MRLYVEPYGGLCNRMRCVTSAYQYAVDHHMELTIIWCRLDECNCDFHSLFCFAGELKVHVIEIPYCDDARFQRIYYRVLKNVLKRAVKHFYYFYNGEEQDLQEGAYIRSFANWYPSENQYALLKLNEKLQARVDKLVEANNHNLIGVHIRRTDNTVSISNSPTELYFKQISKVREAYKGSKIYIASDDADEILRIRQYFGMDQTVILEGADRSRNTQQGIWDAAVELYILANCKAIIGSYYSSYTDTAAALYNIPKYIVKAEQS